MATQQQPQEEKSLHNTIPSFTQIIFLLIGLPVAWLVIWFLLALASHFFGISFPSVGDVSGLLSIIGGIMGAIFTMGGLVVALVAVLTQIQLQDRINQEVAKAKQSVEDTFNNVLRVEYEKRIQEQVEGMLAFAQARDVNDWRQAEQLTREALQKYPKLLGARSFLGLRLSKEVQTHFFLLLHSSLPVPQGLQYPTDDPSLYYTSTYLSRLSFSSAEPPRLEAVEWLKEALEHQDNPEGRVSADLALMYGFNETYEKMIEAIQEACQINPDQLSYLQSSNCLMMLIYACNSDHCRIQKLMELLQLQPVREQDVVTSLSQLTSSTDQFVDFYAVDSRIGVAAVKMPIIIRIYRPRDIDNVKQTRATIYRQGQQTYNLPGADTGKSALQFDDLIKDLFADFLFICPA